MYLEFIKKKVNGKTYKTALIRESYRDAHNKVKHRTVANLSKLPDHKLKAIKAVLADQASGSQEFDLGNAREYGGSFTFLHLARSIKMDTLLYSRKEHWRENALALIIGRILFQGSKLSLANIHSDSALWQLLGHERDKAVDVNEHCYKAMDQLLARQDSIQKTLAQKHLSDGCLILYDITNTWLEGEYKESTLAQHGKGKGGKHGYKQIAIGLITNKEGCPVATEVFSGNTSDQMTVLKQAQELALKYGIEDVIFTGDRGMLTPKRISEVNELGYKTLTALTHPQINQLIEKKVIQLELFDETNIEEVLDPDNPGVRYMLCKNPETLKRERHTRDSLIKRVSCELDKIATVQKKRDPQTVSAKVGGIFKQFNIQKFFEWHVSPEGKLEWTLRQEVIDYEKLLDGCYVIRTDTDNDQLNAKETVKSYKSLAHVTVFSFKSVIRNHIVSKFWR